MGTTLVKIWIRLEVWRVVVRAHLIAMPIFGGLPSRTFCTYGSTWMRTICWRRRFKVWIQRLPPKMEGREFLPTFDLNRQNIHLLMRLRCWKGGWWKMKMPAIGHGIGRKDIPIMARLAKARRWSKRWWACLSSPDLTASQWVMARRSKYVDATYYVKILQNPR